MLTPIRRSIVLGCVVLAVSCASPAEPTQGISPARLLQTHVRFDIFASEGVYLVTNAGEWSSLWDRMSTELLTKLPLPLIDFSQSTVVIVASGPKPSSGFPVTINGGWFRGDALEISATFTSPGNCVVTTALTGYVDVVMVPVRVSTATLTAQRVPRNCG